MDPLDEMFNTFEKISKDQQVLITNSEQERFFEKVAEHYNITSISELETKVAELTNNNKRIGSALSTWKEKLALDRTRLKNVFSKKKNS